MRLITILGGLLLFVATGMSQVAAEPRMGLWLDESRSSNCATVSPYQAVEMWLWVEGADEGAQSISFRVLYPGNVAPSTITYSPNMSQIFGSIYDGGFLDFGYSCEESPFWAFHQTVYVMDQDPGIIQLAPYVGSPSTPYDDLRITPCSAVPGTLMQHADRSSSVGINCCLEDLTPPVIEFVRCVSSTHLEVLFSEAVAPGPASDVARYKVYERVTPTQEIGIAGASLLPDGRTVAIDLAAPISDNTGYFLRETGVPDEIGNAWVSHGQFGNGPDLTIVSASVPDTLSDCVLALPVTLRVANIGGMTAGQFDLSYVVQYLDENGAWAPQWNNWNPQYLCVFSEGLAPGDTVICDQSIPFPFPYAQYGSLKHPMRILFAVDRCPNYGEDCTQYVYEAREDNNSITTVTAMLSPSITGLGCIGVPPSCDSTGITFARSALDTASIEWPVTSYEVYKRGIFGDPASLAAVIPASGSASYSISVPWAPDREFVYFSVVAVQQAGGETNTYRSCESRVQRQMPPVALTGVTARQAECGLLFDWNPSPEPDVVRYVIFRGTSADFAPDTLELSNAIRVCQQPSCNSTEFCYPAWQPGDGYFFKIAAFDYFDKHSPFSLIAPDMVIATTLRQWDALVKDFAVEITWALSAGSSAREFVVSRAIEGGGTFSVCAGAVEARGGLEFAWTDKTVEPGNRYLYRVESIEEGARTELFETESMSIPPRPLALMQNRPNPFNPSTTIDYYLPRSGTVRLVIYDIAGREVARVVDEVQQAGSHSVVWLGSNNRNEALASGIYLYRLIFEKKSITRKLVLLR